jgi:hypothetical protein
MGANSNVMKQQNWIFAFASVIGNGHILEKIPCQDQCDVQTFDNYSIAVVSDGAGSCQHSDKGSKFIVNNSINHFYNVIKEHKWDQDNELPSKEDWHNTAKKTLCKIKEDLFNYSINEDVEFKSLSCTVIIVIAFKHGLLVTHIGDGRAGYCNSNFDWQSIITPYHGEFANQTVFITSDIWYEEIIDNYIESTVIDGDVNAFCLLSDGCEKASFECNLYDSEKRMYFDPNRPFPLFFDPNLKVLQQLFEQEKSQEEINKLWEKFLTVGTEKLRVETDDKSLVLAVKAVNKIIEG